MILIGDKNVPFEKLTFIQCENDIKSTASNSTVIFNFDFELMKYCKTNDINYGVVGSSIKEAIYANSLDAKYIITIKNISKYIQKIATNYMFDSKVLAIISSDEEIEEVALNEIDGAIYKKLLD